MSARNLQVERLSKSYLKDIIEKEQLGLWKAFKQEKADDSNTMYNSLFRPNNDMEIMEIHWGRFG